MTKKLIPVILVIVATTSFSCSPTVKIAPPSEPITINLNVKIQHEILVKVDKELDNVFSEDNGLF